jgi:hypothetical protein
VNWHKPTAYAQRSMCECYSVAKVGNYVGKMVYEIWKTRLHPSGLGLVETGLTSAAEARKLCEKYDADQNA